MFVKENPDRKKNVLVLYYKDLDDNLAWLTQKTEESKCNKEKFTFFHTQSKCN